MGLIGVLHLIGTVAIITGSSADDSTAEEARAAAQALGCYSYKLANASVDGLHSILPNLSGRVTDQTVQPAAPAVESVLNSSGGRVQGRLVSDRQAHWTVSE